MSILINGMDMPKCCTECSCCRHDNWNGETAHQCNVSLITFGAEDENWIYDQRPNWCPLIEIPTPHGRLIDVDEPMTKISTMMQEPDYQHEGDGWMVGLIMARDALDEAPTVIEAEGARHEQVHHRHSQRS